MKLITILALTAALLVLSVQQAKAPVPIYLGLALKCIATGTIGGTAIILWRCEPDYYLVRYCMDGEDTYWACSQASATTLSKTGGTRCEGPWKDRSEPDLRAWVNNHTPEQPMYPCGPLGSPIPGPTWTNYSIVSLQQSYNGGRLWRSAGDVLVAPGEANWSVCLLGPEGTNNMSREQIREVLDCDLVIPRNIPLGSDFKDYRVRGVCYALSSEVVSNNRSKTVRETQ